VTSGTRLRNQRPKPGRPPVRQESPASARPRQRVRVRQAQAQPVIAYLESEQLAPGAVDTDRDTVIAALEQAGVKVERVKWDGKTKVDWGKYAVAFHGSPWSNWRKMGQYLHFVADLEKLGLKQINPPKVIRAGSNKKYLLRLAERGVNIIPTKIERANTKARNKLGSSRKPLDMPLDLPKVERDRLERQHKIEQLFTIDGVLHEEIVLKPLTAGGAAGASRFRLDGADGALTGEDAYERMIELHKEGRDVVVEQYIAEVESKRELSQYVTNGVVTHATTKRALLGHGERHDAVRESHPDKQPHDATEDEVRFAEEVWERLKEVYKLTDQDDVSVRIDSIDGQLLEIEMIAPVKSFDICDGRGLPEFVDMMVNAANTEWERRRLGDDLYAEAEGGELALAC
jgi:hypothetical protein